MTAESDIMLQWFLSNPAAQQSFLTLVVVLGMWAAYWIVKTMIARGVSDLFHRQNYRAFSRYLFVVLGLMLAAGVWLEELKTVGLVLTGVLAGFLIGFKEVFLGIVGRIVVGMVHLYRIGDRICINGVCGDVINLGLLYTWVFESGGEDGSRQATGRVVSFPHMWLFQYPVQNLNRMNGFLWDEMEFRVPADTQLTPVMELLQAEANALAEGQLDTAQRATQEIRREFAVRLPPLPPVVYASLAYEHPNPPAVSLVLRYLVPERGIRERRNALTLRILPELRRMGVIPTPQSPEETGEDADA